MIEVEKKFSLTEEQLARLTKDALFLHQQKFTDIYFDNSTFDIGKRNFWFRKRGDNFELKVPTGVQAVAMNVFREVSDLREIAALLSMKQHSDDFEENIYLNGFEKLAEIVTTRRKYKLGDYTIDADEADFGHRVCEIERMVDREDQIEEAQEKIFELARSFGLEIKPTHGKLLEYIVRYNPTYYETLEKLGIIGTRV